MRIRYAKGRQPLTIVGLLFLSFMVHFNLTHAGEIVLSSVGSNQWQVTSSGLSNVQALDLYLRYDPTRLPGAVVTLGGGVGSNMTAMNDKMPGLIRLGVAATQPLPQNGLLLKIQSSTPGSELLVTSFTVTVLDGAGKSVPTTLRQQLSGQNTLPPSTPTSIGLTGTRGTGIGSVTLPGGSVLTTEGPKKADPEATITSPTAPDVRKGSTSATSASALTASFGTEKRFHSQEEIVAVIERLPKPWTVAAVKAIFFKAPSASQVRQEPVVALADGISSVMLFLPKSQSKNKPTIGSQGVSLGMIWDAKDQGWQIDLVTKKNSWPATVLLMGEADLIQFPVVIVPKLDQVTLPTNHDFPLPQIDFDKDGSVTAMDAYLFVGNLLAQAEMLQRK